MRGLRRARLRAPAEHRCPGACGQLIPIGRFACPQDWERLPWNLRSRIIDTAADPGKARDEVRARASQWFADNPWVRPL